MDSRLQLSFITSPSGDTGPWFLDQWISDVTAVVTTKMRMGHNGENPDGHNENWWLQSLQLYFILLYTNLRREGQKIQRLWCLSYQLSRGKKRCLTSDLTSLPGIFPPQHLFWTQGSSQPSNLVGPVTFLRPQTVPEHGQLGIPSFSDLLQGVTWFSNDGPRSVSRPQLTCVSDHCPVGFLEGFWSHHWGACARAPGTSNLVYPSSGLALSLLASSNHPEKKTKTLWFPMFGPHIPSGFRSHCLLQIRPGVRQRRRRKHEHKPQAPGPHWAPEARISPLFGYPQLLHLEEGWGDNSEIHPFSGGFAPPKQPSRPPVAFSCPFPCRCHHHQIPPPPPSDVFSKAAAKGWVWLMIRETQGPTTVAVVLSNPESNKVWERDQPIWRIAATQPKNVMEDVNGVLPIWRLSRVHGVGI